jgi:Amt family ammonium transporter
MGDALVIGPFGSILFMLSKKMLIKLDVDDMHNQFALHGICGLWGLIAVGIFNGQKGLVH